MTCGNTMRWSLASTLPAASPAMPHGVFTIDVRFEENHLTAEGADRVKFRVTRNLGQQAISKASGGELSLSYGHSGDYRP